MARKPDPHRIAQLEAEIGLDPLPGDPPRPPVPLRRTSPAVAKEERASVKDRLLVLFYVICGLAFLWMFPTVIVDPRLHLKWVLWIWIGLSAIPAAAFAAAVVFVIGWGIWALGRYLITGKGPF